MNIDVEHLIGGLTFFKGRVALYALLRAVGLRAGDEVVVPGFTCVVVPSAVVFAGGTPIYADIAEATLNISPESLERAIGPRTRAVIVQHTFGIPVNMGKVKEICRGRDILLIEDCAHCLVARQDGKAVGKLGDAAFFSTQWSKPFTTGLGGIAVAREGTLRERLEAVAEQFPMPGMRRRMMLRAQLAAFRRFYSPRRFWSLQGAYRALGRLGAVVASSSGGELVGVKPRDYEMRMGPYQEALLRAYLGDGSRIGMAADWRRRRARQYADGLASSGLLSPNVPENAEPDYLRYPVRVGNKRQVLELARQRRVEIGDWFVSPLHPTIGALDRLGYQWGRCPVAERLCEEVVNLPTHLGVSEDEAQRTLEFLVDSAVPILV